MSDVLILSAAQIEQHFGIPATSVRQWAHRGKIVARAHCDGHPLYAMSDVQKARKADGRKTTRRALR